MTAISAGQGEWQSPPVPVASPPLWSHGYLHFFYGLVLFLMLKLSVEGIFILPHSCSYKADNLVDKMDQ